MKKKHYLLFLLASLFLLTDVVWAQTSATVSGVVIDENGETLPGVSVVEVGTTNGVLTDLNGHYTLKTTSAKPSVSFSYIGYQTTTLPLNGRTKLDVQMKVETKILDEVVVVGYGVQKKVNLTGSVTSINFADQTEGRPIMSVSSALSGLAAGMNVTQASGQPGSDGATIRVRGNGTFNTNSPLVLVDGIEWSMDNVNPNDIESISVLKDAASTAIYGTRAANGVILITTKSGKGKPQISYSYSGVVQMPYNNLSFVSDYARYMGLVNEACENVNTKGIFSQESIDRWRAASADPNGLNEYGVPNYVAYPNTDWFDEVFDTGYSQEHNLSVSGSSEKVKYMLSLGYLDNQGVMNRWNLDSSTQKINFRTNLEAKIVKWMTVGTRLYGQKQDYGMANISNGFKYLYQTTPGVYPGEPNYWGRPALASEESSNANNIFGQMAGATGFNTVWRLNASVYGIITPYKGLNIEGTFNYSPTFTDKSSYSRQNGYWDYVTDQRVSESALENASITNTSARTWRQSAEILVRYQTTIKKDHDLGALLGYSAQEYYSKSFAVSRKGATDWTLNELSTYETLVSSSSSAPAKWGLLSYFGRVNYGYKGRYLFEANLRADASSRFGVNQRWGYFPSFSGGWRISEESFMQGASDYLSNLKLRVSWGKTGNNSTGNYDWQANYATGNVVIDGEGTKGLVRKKLSNDKLHWESTATTDIGLDFGFFNNRINGEIDIYNKDTKDLLLYAEVPGSLGFSSVQQNIGSINNRGLEFSINTVNFVGGKGKFKWTTNFNISFNKSKVTGLSDGQESRYSSVITTNNYICKVGHPLSEMYGYVYDGVYQYEDFNEVAPGQYVLKPEIPNNTEVRSNIQPGSVKLKDLNGDGKVTAEDQTIIGHGLPIHTGGFTNNFEWKGFDLSVFFQWSYGNDVINYNRTRLESLNSKHTNQLVSAANHWTPRTVNPDGSITEGNYTNYLCAPNRSLTNINTDREIEDASFLRLKNVQLGYSFPTKMLKNLKIRSLRVYVSAQNIWTWTKYTGYDPEVSTRNSAMTRGFDYSSYPRTRSYTFGVKLGL